MNFKSVLKTAIFGIFLLLSGVALAAPSLSSLKSAVGHPPAKTSTGSNQSLKSVEALGYPTEVYVVNNSSDVIYVTIPGSVFSMDAIFPGQPPRVYYSNYYFDCIYMNMYDYFGYRFFSQYVPNYSTVYVDDSYFFMSGAKTDGKEKKANLKVTIKPNK